MISTVLICPGAYSVTAPLSVTLMPPAPVGSMTTLSSLALPRIDKVPLLTCNGCGIVPRFSMVKLILAKPVQRLRQELVIKADGEIRI
jgi:hypothetical protein